MSLQGKYMQGEMNDQDYNSQRDYYKNELQGMIRRLDETKKLMMLMAQIQSGPSGPVRTISTAARSQSTTAIKTS